MKRLSIILAAVALVLPASASAIPLSAGHLSVEANLSEIQYEVEICGARNRNVHVVGLYGEVGNEETYSSDFYVRPRHKCAVWTLTEETPMWSGAWDAVVVVHAYGRTAHTEDVEFTVE